MGWLLNGHRSESEEKRLLWTMPGDCVCLVNGISSVKMSEGVNTHLQHRQRRLLLWMSCEEVPLFELSTNV